MFRDPKSDVKNNNNITLNHNNKIYKKDADNTSDQLDKKQDK